MKKIYALGIKHLIFAGEDYADTGDRTVRVVDRIDENGQIHCLVNEFYPFIDEAGCKEVSGVTSKQHHDIYEKEYPDGFEVVWIGCYDTEIEASKDVLSKLTGKLFCQQ